MSSRPDEVGITHSCSGSRKTRQTESYSLMIAHRMLVLFKSCRGPHIYDQGISHRYLNRRREANGKRSKKGTLIYNYENLELSEDVIRHLDVHRERWVGQSRWRADVLILRDPFNLLASVLRSRRQGNPVAGAPALERARRIWKSYAREFCWPFLILQKPHSGQLQRMVRFRGHSSRPCQYAGVEFGRQGVGESRRVGPGRLGRLFRRSQ